MKTKSEVDAILNEAGLAEREDFYDDLVIYRLNDPDNMVVPGYVYDEYRERYDNVQEATEPELAAIESVQEELNYYINNFCWPEEA